MNEQLRSQVTAQPHFRIASLNRQALNVEKRTADLSFASEKTPIERYWGIEVLDFSSREGLLTRWRNKPAFMENHRTRRGVINDGKLEGGVLSGTAKLSRNQAADDLLRDMEDDIAVHTSVGYFIHRADEMKPEEMDEQLKQMCLESGLRAYRCQAEPFEGSSVDIPADITVGLGKRSLEYFDLQDISSPDKVLEGVRSFKPPAPDAVGTDGKQQPNQRSITMSDPNKKEPTREDVLKEERQRVSGIEEIAKRFTGKLEKVDEMRDKAVRDGLSVDEFKYQVAESMASREEPPFTPDSQTGMSTKEQKSYSLLRVIQSQIPNSKVKAEFEREVSNHIAERVGKSPKGFFIPWEVQNREISVSIQSRTELDYLKRLAIQHGLNHAARDLTVGGSGTGAELVGTALVASSFIELLRNRAVAAKVGVQTLFGLVGNFAMPRQTSAGTFYWVGETGTTTESTAGTGSITLSPKEGAAYQEYSRMLLLQSTPSVELLVQNDLLNVARLGIDLAVFHGSAASNQPRGIVNESGVGSVTGTDLGWSGVVEFQTDVMTGNADVDTMYYVTNPTVLGYLKTRPKFANSPLPITGDDMRTNGYPTIISNQISSGHMFFGDFSQEILGYWGNLDILVNPFTLDTTRHTRVSIAVDVDCRLRQAGAISVSSTIT